MKRIAKELEKMRGDSDLADVGCSIDVQNPNCWIISFVCPEGTIYEGERYALRVTMGPSYPIDSPEVALHSFHSTCL
jgi:ubiquitin-protein ligase